MFKGLCCGGKLESSVEVVLKFLVVFEGPAIIKFAGLPAEFRCQVSGVRFQQKDSTRCVGVAHEMNFLSPVLAFSCIPISVQDSVFTDT
jgi:hypothetical protein